MQETLKDPPGTGAIALMEAAEQLIAEKGIDGVSSREVARLAGHKNHSAVNYNFGSYDDLVEALIGHRSAPISQQRKELFAALLAAPAAPSLEDLVGLMVRPMAAQLLAPAGQHHFLNLLSQLLTRDHWQQVFLENRRRDHTLLRIGEQVEARLHARLPSAVCHERLQRLGNQIVHCVAEWDSRIRAGTLEATPEALNWRIEDFIVCSVAALTAPTRPTSPEQ
jgi:AcrR family transcriptional regulator